MNNFLKTSYKVKFEVVCIKNILPHEVDGYKNAIQTIVQDLTPEETTLLAKAIKNPVIKSIALENLKNL